MTYLINYLKRILLLLFIYSVSRFFFFINNSSNFSIDSSSDVSIFSLFFESLRFDFSILLYINSIVLILLLFPSNLHLKRWYPKLIDYVFYLINIPFIFLNNIDIEFFQFNNKRITYDFVDFILLGNDGLQILPAYIMQYWPIVLLTLLQIILLTKLKPYNSKKVFFTFRSLSKSTLIFLFSISLFIVGARGGLQLKPIKVINAGELTSPVFSSLILNTPFCFLHSFNNTQLASYNYFDANVISEHYNTKHSFDTKKFSNKNVVIIIMESLSKEFVGFYNNTNLTPFLDSLMGHSLVFNNAFSNGLRSIEALPAITASIPTFSNTPFITSVYAQNNFNSLASILSEKGYSTSFFHGGTRGTMGFYGFTKRAGFSEYYGLEEYGNKNDYDGTWGIYDEPFFDFFANKLKKEQKPFFSTFFSLSAHPPYSIPEKYNDVFEDGDLAIHRLIRYSDHSLKTFFDKIKDEEWFNNTIFVITADHTSPKSNNPNYKNKLGRYSIPMLFYSPSKDLLGENNVITQHIDIMPSILDYLGYKNSFFSFGESVFKKNSWAIHFNKDKYCFISDKSILYNFQEEYTNFSNWKLNNQITVDSLDLIKLKSIKQVYSNSMIKNSLLIK